MSADSKASLSQADHSPSRNAGVNDTDSESSNERYDATDFDKAPDTDAVNGIPKSERADMNIELTAISWNNKQTIQDSDNSSTFEDGQEDKSVSSSTSIEKHDKQEQESLEETGISLREGLTDWHYCLRMVAALSAHFTFPSVLYHLTLHFRNVGVEPVLVCSLFDLSSNLCRSRSLEYDCVRKHC